MGGSGVTESSGRKAPGLTAHLKIPEQTAQAWFQCSHAQAK
jgi:hypothetical protein